MAQPKATEAKPEQDATQDESILVVDVGKKFRRKHIRRLRKGRGKLMREVEDLVADLRQEKALGDNVQPVVIVVREKRKKRKLLW